MKLFRKLSKPVHWLNRFLMLLWLVSMVLNALFPGNTEPWEAIRAALLPFSLLLLIPVVILTLSQRFPRKTAHKARVVPFLLGLHSTSCLFLYWGILGHIWYAQGIAPVFAGQNIPLEPLRLGSFLLLMLALLMELLLNPALIALRKRWFTKHPSISRITALVLFAIAALLLYLGHRANQHPSAYSSANLYPGLILLGIGMVLLLCSLLAPAIREHREHTIYRSMEGIDGMEGHDFEYFCAQLLRGNGFTDVSVTPGSGDQGADILAVRGTARYAIQCKNYASSVGNAAVQEVIAAKAFYHCQVGAVMTNSTFTSSAMELAQAAEIHLWDRQVLQKMMAQAKDIL